MSTVASPLRSRYLPQLQAQAQQGQVDPTTGQALTPPDASGSDASIYGNAQGSSAIPALNLDPNAPIHNMYYQDQGVIQAGANQLNNEAASQLNYYGPIQQQYQQKQDTALNQLNQTPGFTAPEASQINQDYSQYNTGQGDYNNTFLTGDEQSAINGDPNAPKTVANQGAANEQGALDQYTQGAGAQLNSYQANLGGQVGAYQQNLSGQLDNNASGVGKSVSGLSSGLQGAQSGFGKLDTAVSNPGLAFDPNSTEKQITDADVQQMKTAAGTRVGNQYQSAEDTLQRNAAAAGNTSPLALAAANARLQTQEASNQGDAETSADIAAKQAQQQQATSIEQQREGAVNTQTGYRANAATTEQAQAQNAAALAGTTGVSAAENVGAAGINAANTYGQSAINAANTYGENALAEQNAIGQTQQGALSNIANQTYNAANTEDQTASARAAALAGNRQTSQTAENASKYNQGTGSAQMTSQGAQAVGNARITGQGNYRAGVAGQQQLAQQGGQNAVAQQQQAYGTETSGLNSSTASRGQYQNTGTTLAGQIGQGLGSILGPAASAYGSYTKSSHATGGIITKPEIARIGERGPEMVSSMGGRYKRLVTKPTIAILGEHGPETVTPMNNNPSNKVSRYRHVA